MIGRNIMYGIAVLVVLLSGCSSKSFIFGEEKGFCKDCQYEYKGVCANPMDIYYNSDIVMNKPTKCSKKVSKRSGVRN